MPAVSDNVNVVVTQHTGTTLGMLASALHDLSQQYGSKCKANVTAASTGVSITIQVTKTHN